MSTEAKKNPPVAKIQVRRVQVAIWSRSTDKGTFFDATVQNGYKDRDGKWRNGQSFDADGLLALKHAAGLAVDKIAELRAADVSDTDADVSDVAEDEIPS